MGDDLARRYQPDVNLFAATRDSSTAAQAALAALVPPGERVFLVEAGEFVPAASFRDVQVRTGLQMVADHPIAAPGKEFAVLGDEDAAEMVALARLTEPGPFLSRTHVMGQFIGVRIRGRLAAMAGERFRLAGYSEVSGVCTHPDFRGQGWARRLSAAVAARIQARGEQPFLHSWSTNRAAIALYESLGFRRRADVNVVILQR